MTNNEQRRYYDILRATITELEARTRHRDSIHVEAGGDELERFVGAAERELAVRNLEALSSRLRAARAAVQRIEDGAYGLCVNCDDEISPMRLAALPAAALCIRCQERNDSRPAPVFAWPEMAAAA